MNTNDLALLDRWRRERDAEAFRELVARHAGMVYGTCCRILGNATDAEDVTQDCFLQLAQRPLRAKRSVGGWLHSLATHRALDRMKAESRRRAREERFANAPEPRRERESLSDHVDEALAELDEMQRSLLVLHFFEGHSHEDIARGLDVSRSTVTRRIAEGVEQVRTRLRAKGVAVPAAALAAALLEFKAEALPATLATALGKVAIAGGGSAATAVGASTVLKVLAATVAVMLAVGGAVVVWQAPDRMPARVQAAAVEPPATEQAPEMTETVASPAASVFESPVLDAALTSPEQQIEEASSPSPTTGALVEGIVLDLHQTPVPNARVDCYGSGVGFRGSTQIFTDERGRFQYNDVPPTDVFSVYASTDDPPRRTNQETLKKIGAGERYNLILVLHEAAVSGRVVDASGKPVGDAEVMAQPVQWISYGIPMGRSDATGHYTIRGLAEGEYELKANWAGGRTPWPDEGLPVTLRPDEVREGFLLPLGSEGGLAIAGHVTNEAGEGINDVHVVASMLDPPNISRWVRTDIDGAFIVDGLTDGNYSVTSSHPDYGIMHEGEVAAGRDDLNVVLQPRGAIEGVVVDALTHVPVRNFEVFELTPLSDIDHYMLVEEYRVVEDAKGQFTRSKVGPGEIPVRVRAEGYAEWSERVEVPAGGLAQIVVELKRSRMLGGRVVNAEGEAVIGAIVFAGAIPHDVNSSVVGSIRTDSQGHFELTNLDPNAGFVTCYHPQYSPGYASVSPTADGVTIIVDQGIRVRGTVTVAGEPATPAYVAVSCPEWWKPARMQGVDERGAFEIAAVPRTGVILTVSIRGLDGAPDYHIYRSLQVDDSADIVTVDVEIPVGTSTVQGIIYEDDKPRGGLYMVLQLDEQDGWSQTYSTHAAMGDGAYRFDNVPAGNGVVRVYPIGAPQERDAVEIPVVVREGEVVTCDVEIPAE